MNRRILLITLLLTGVFAMGAPRGVSIHKLNNGMDVLMIENRALPMVGVNVVIKTGSAYETYETSGMSHMLEHLLFNGTTSRSQRELYDAVDLIGGYNNANTGEYYTNFMMVMPAEHQVAGMEIQADMLFNSILPGDKFEKEKGIVLEEIAQSLSKPATQMDYNLNAELYDGHALGLPTLGTYATIQHMKRDDVAAYYSGTYLPNNMVLSVIGDFDSAEMLKEIERIYGSAAPRAVFRPQTQGLSTGFSTETLDLPVQGSWLDRYYGGEVPTLHQIYTLPADAPKGFSLLLESALKRQLEELEIDLKARWPEAIEGLTVQLHSKPVISYLEVKVNLKQSQNTQKINTDLHKRLSKMRFRLDSGTINAMATKERTAFLQNTEKPHMFGIYNAHDLAVVGIDGVLELLTDDDLEEAYLALKNFRLSDQPAAIMHHSQMSSSKTSDKQITTELVQDPAEGMGLIVRQNPASELLAIHYLFKHKTALEAEHGKDAAKILHDCFGQRMKTPEKLEESQRFGLKFTVNDNPWIPMDNIYLHPDFGYIRVEGLATDLEEAIGFLNREMAGFTPTEAEYMQAKNKFSKGMTHGQKDKAKDRFDSLVDSLLYGEIQTREAPELTYTGLIRFGQQYFAAVNRVVSLVSPGDVSRVGKQMLTLNSKGSTKTFPLTDKNYLPLEAGVTLEEQGGGERSYLFYGYSKQVDPGDEAAIRALGLILSDRIVFDVREKQGLAYRMTATTGIRDDRALFYISLGTRPQNAETLIPQFPTLLSMKTLEGLTEQDVQKSINMYLGRMMFRRLSSINQAYYLGTSLFFKGDMHADEVELQALGEVTLEDVQRVASKYLMPENTISVTIH